MTPESQAGFSFVKNLNQDCVMWPCLRAGEGRNSSGSWRKELRSHSPYCQEPVHQDDGLRPRGEKKTSAEIKNIAGRLSLYKGWRRTASVWNGLLLKLNQAKSISVGVVLHLICQDWASFLCYRHPLFWKIQLWGFQLPNGLVLTRQCTSLLWHICYKWSVSTWWI